MRQLTDNEQRIVEKIVQLKQSTRLEELQVARLLRKELGCFALRWTLEPKKTLVFYSCQDESTTDIDWDSLRKHYFQVADFLYFIEELEQEHFIKTQTLSFEVKTDEERALYDRCKFKYNASMDAFWGKKGTISYLVSINAEQKVYIDFVSYLEKYANKIIYPLPLLEDFVANDYKSIEQRHFEKQIEENERHHKEQMKNGRKSFYAALCAVAVSAVTPFCVEKCTEPIEIDESQLESLEQSIIKSCNALPDTINVQICQPNSDFDTLKTKFN